MEKVTGVWIHPMIESFRDARKGEPVTLESRRAYLAILKKALEGEGVFFFRPLEIAVENRIDTLAISQMMDWWTEAKYVEKDTSTNQLKYRLTPEFCRFHGITF